MEFEILAIKFRHLPCLAQPFNHADAQQIEHAGLRVWQFPTAYTRAQAFALGLLIWGRLRER